MKFEFKEVFITGSNGWLGRQIVNSLITNDPDVLDMKIEKSIKINCLINENETTEFFKKYYDKINIFRGDLRSSITIENFISETKKGLLIHAAGVIHPKKIKDFYDINFTATSKLIDRAIEKK